MSNSIAPGSSADVNVKVTALTTNPNVPAQYKTIILKKNLVNGVNTLTQEMMSAINTKYVVKYDYTLAEDIDVPNNCILDFDGGSINGSHTLTGQKTEVINANVYSIQCGLSGISYVVKVDSIISLLKANLTYLPEGIIVETINGFWGENKDNLRFRVWNYGTICIGNNIKLYPVFINNTSSPVYFGSIGNWTNHPVSEKLTLNEAQTLYIDNNISLTDEIDAIAIQKAVDLRIPTFIPYGGYKLNKTIVLPSIQTTIYSDGNRTAQLTFYNCDGIVVTNQFSVIKNLMITSDDIVADVIGTTNLYKGITSVQKIDCLYEGLTINGFNVAIDCGSDSYGTEIRQCNIKYCNTGINHGDHSNGVVISNNYITYCKTAIVTGNGVVISIKNNIIEKNNIGVDVKVNSVCKIDSCYFEANGSSNNENNYYDIYIPATTVAQKILCTISNCRFFISQGFTNKACIFVGVKNDIIIENNRFATNLGSGSAISGVASENDIVFNNNELINVSLCKGYGLEVIIDKIKCYNNNPSVKQTYLITNKWYKIVILPRYTVDKIGITLRVGNPSKMLDINIATASYNTLYAYAIGDNLPDVQIGRFLNTSGGIEGASQTESLFIKNTNNELCIAIIKDTLGVAEFIPMEDSDMPSISSVTIHKVAIDS